MARFMFIWTIMLGAMVGVREFDAFRGRSVAAAAAARRGGRAAARPARRARGRLRVRLRRHRVHALRLEAHLRARRPAALAHPRRLAGDRRDVDRLPRRAGARRPQDHFRESLRDGFRPVAGNGGAAFCSAASSSSCSCACRSRSRSRSPACRSSRSSRGSTR